MSVIASLPRRLPILQPVQNQVRLYHIGRAASVDIAIARGIRKSNGLGLRGKHKPAPDDPREKYKQRHGIPEFNPTPKAHKSEWQGTQGSPWMGRGRVQKQEVSRDSQKRPRLGDRLGFEREKSFGQGRWRDNNDNTSRRPVELDAFKNRRSSPAENPREGQRDKQRGGSSLGERSGTRSTSRQGYSLRDSDGRIAGFNESSSDSKGLHRPVPNFSRKDSLTGPRGNGSSGHDSRSMDTLGSRTRFESGSKSVHDSNTTSVQPQHSEDTTTTFDRRIPLSIPYTTPASEFLYGTSPILAALQSTRQPRRKLYKLYVHSTPQREDPQQDQNLIRLAKRAGVSIENVTGDNIRLLDKMSGGRPHNGYILEASPLPRLPVLSLGKVTDRGFEISLGHQSREDAAINGTEPFISVSQSTQQIQKRQPLVLYLDSITDPGNLGGIIRTASFLGVTAVAISTRNSAPLSPVVLKASAGAAENITLLSVEKPAGFIVDSKTAGWKIYAAVAPEKGVDRPSLSVEKLDDPLADSPVILMLGSEGEGLRWNLRSKADLDLYIRGAGGRGGVDSLNVSVAAGVLCNAFLRGSKRAKATTAARNDKIQDFTKKQQEATSTLDVSVSSDGSGIPIDRESLESQVEPVNVEDRRGNTAALF